MKKIADNQRTNGKFMVFIHNPKYISRRPYIDDCFSLERLNIENIDKVRICKDEDEAIAFMNDFWVKRGFKSEI